MKPSLASKIDRFPKVLIVLCKDAEPQVRSALSQAAHANSELQGQLRLLVRPDHLWRFAKENSDLITKIAPKLSGTRIIIVGEVDVGTDLGREGDTRAVSRFRDHHSFEKSIEPILRQCGLDWRTWISTEVRLWQHGTVDNARVEHWLGQFRRLGCLWVGEHLLRHFDFWNADRIRAGLRIDPATTEQSNYVCLKRQDPGKSGDFLGNLARKSMSNFARALPIRDFVELLNSEGFQPSRLLFVEDSLLTGTEMTNYLAALLGNAPPAGRSPKWPAVRDAKLLRDSEIEFRFPVVTSLGKLRLEKFLAEYGLSKARLGYDTSGYFEVLTNAGEQAVKDGNFFHPGLHNCPLDADSHVSQVAFHRTWKKDQMRNEATAFCREIGAQLFAQYLNHKGWDWPPEKIHLCGLGMHGLALNMGFCHSVPKATLPLFWAAGKIKWDGTQLDWEPLFPNAA